MKRKLRLISLMMLFVAIIFVGVALSCPTCGHTLYIGDFRFGAEQWRFCYGVYVVIMIVLFGYSFWVKD